MKLLQYFISSNTKKSCLIKYLFYVLGFNYLTSYYIVINFFLEISLSSVEIGSLILLLTFTSTCVFDNECYVEI